MNPLEALEQTIASRAGEDPDVSWTARLLAGGRPRCAQKLGEEAVEAAIAGVVGSRREIVAESADVLYHLLVLLAANGIALSEVMAELESRSGQSGIEEKSSRKTG